VWPRLALSRWREAWRVIVAEIVQQVAGVADQDTQNLPRKPFHVMHVVRKGIADGGMENGIVNLAKFLPAEKYRVSVCALDSQETFSQRITRKGSDFPLLPKHGAGIAWSLIRPLANIFRKHDVDLVHSHNWGTFIYSVMAARSAGLPIVHGEHGKNLNEVAGDALPKRLIKRFIGRRADKILTVSEPLAKEWRGYGIPAAKVECIPNGVDTERFRPRTREEKIQARATLNIPVDSFVAGSIGRLDQLKNYGALLEAFITIAKRMPALHIALLGTGPLESELKQQASRSPAPERVHFLGHRRDPENFLGALDVFVLPSKYEGMSNVVLEAMSTGLPVVTADLPGHRQVFEHKKEGLIVAPCEAEPLATVLEELYGGEARRLEIGAEARARIMAEFSIEKMVAGYDALYSEFMGGESRCAQISGGPPG
jgi:sugar transferase (PEP-CTERM/EpsH1 system associated)